MRPGEQQPGGESWSNPYQQPGYQQNNPYRAEQPGGPWQAAGDTPPPVPPPGGGGGRRRTVIAVAAVVVLVVAGVLGRVFVVAGDDGEPEAGGEQSPSAEETERPAAPDDPRQGVVEQPDPVVAPDWQVQTNEDRNNAFDVPPEDWEIESASTARGYEQEVPGEEPTGEMTIGVMAPAVYLNAYCAEAEYLSDRAMAGTRGGQGYTGTEEAAAADAERFALAAWAGTHEAEVEVGEPEPFESEHGLVGHTVTATVTGLPQGEDSPCGPPAGRVTTVSYLDPDNDLATWVLVADVGVPEALDEETIGQIMNSLRPFPAESD
ncbi:hypothetical protein [Streptomyces johnsoniae]|uniref:DUF8017 domain-containing protein n=1 Tax=Streptomyces johnsoniae TaxID=3075532 RepID=A0ABU2SCB5_9ACTN|nr:hypothetical protein [Streptomyces sp. DSM 41886]MDT0446606.1 hypothetical protein [Streptomyces sp. DSM 41886]